MENSHTNDNSLHQLKSYVLILGNSLKVVKILNTVNNSETGLKGKNSSEVHFSN